MRYARVGLSDNEVQKRYTVCIPRFANCGEEKRDRYPEQHVGWLLDQSSRVASKLSVRVGQQERDACLDMRVEAAAAELLDD